jgi:hypothetical protein
MSLVIAIDASAVPDDSRIPVTVTVDAHLDRDTTR